MIFKFKSLFEKYEHLISPVTFLSGFLWDFFTLNRIDLWFENVSFLAYLFAAGAGIVFVHLRESGRFRMKYLEEYGDFMSLPMQFAFGSLFSGFFIFYSRSASVWQSWPFLFILCVILFGNEFLRKYYGKFVLHVSIFFMAVFSYAIFALPVVIGRMGDDVFLASGLISLCAVGVFFFLLFLIFPARIRGGFKAAGGCVAGLFAIFTSFYFINIISPIPLSLKQIGVYHSVTHGPSGDYQVIGEKRAGLGDFFDRYPEFHRARGDAVYVFSSVFAPTRIGTKIFYRWEYYDEKQKVWVTTDRLDFDTVGGG